MEGGEWEGRFEERVEEGEGVFGVRCLSFGLSLLLRALLIKVEKGW